MAERCSVEILGGFRVSVDGVAVDTWRNRRAADLVKLLAMTRGHAVHREQLMEALWPSLTVDAAAANLRKAVHYARRALGSEDAVRASSGMLVLWNEATVDADGFLEAARAANDVASAELAIARWPGEPIPADRYEPWAEELREHFLELHRRMLRMAERWDEVLALDPTDEEAHRALMQRHLDDGRRREAIRQFEQLRDALREHMGVGPDPQTVALYEKVLDMEGAEPPTLQERTAALISNALVAWTRREIQEAERLAREARALALEAELGHELGEASTLLALVAHASGTWHQTFREDFEASLVLGDEMAIPLYDAHLCFQDFYLYGPEGHRGAETFAQNLLALSQRHRSRAGESLARLLLGEVNLLSGRLDPAREQLSLAVKMCARGGYVSAQAIALERLAEAEIESGKAGRARALLKQAWPLVPRSSISTHLLVRLHGVTVRAATDVVRGLSAVRDAERALADAPRICPPCSMSFRVVACVTCARAGDLGAAARHLGEAERIAGLWQGGPWEAAIWEGRAAIRLAQGETHQAEALFLEAAGGFDGYARPLDAARCRRAAEAARRGERAPAALS